MTLKKWIAAMLAVCILATGVVYAAGGGTSSDPIVTLSYIQDKLIPNFNTELERKAAAAVPTMSASRDRTLRLLDDIKSKPVTTTAESLRAAIEYEAYMRALDDGLWLNASDAEITLASGEQVVVDYGGEIRLISGAARFGGERSGGAVSVGKGKMYYSGVVLETDDMYIVAAENTACGVLAVGPAKLSISGRYQIVPTVRARHTDAALALRELGLMRGTNKGFELERGATRLEALIMFLRLIGEEQAALAYTGTQPFDDLPVWAGGEPQKYVGYAHSKGYTNGVSATKFGAGEEATVEMYVTFLLRALGYSDKSGDFGWESAPADAVRLGIFTDYERLSVVRRSFSRDDMAYLSWRALGAKDKSGKKLSDKLIAAGTFTQAKYSASPHVRILGQ